MAKQRFRDTKQGKISKIAKTKKLSSDDELRFATKKDYFKAVLTDSFMLLMPIMYIVFYLVFGSREEYAHHWQLGGLYIFAGLAVVESIFLILKGQTPGMKAYNLKLISLYTKKKPLPALIIVRQILSKIVFLMWGWVVMFFRKDNRNLQDIILYTALVYEKPNA